MNAANIRFLVARALQGSEILPTSDRIRLLEAAAEIYGSADMLEPAAFASATSNLLREADLAQLNFQNLHCK